MFKQKWQFHKLCASWPESRWWVKVHWQEDGLALIPFAQIATALKVRWTELRDLCDEHNINTFREVAAYPSGCVKMGDVPKIMALPHKDLAWPAHRITSAMKDLDVSTANHNDCGLKPHPGHDPLLPGVAKFYHRNDGADNEEDEDEPAPLAEAGDDGNKKRPLAWVEHFRRDVRNCLGPDALFAFRAQERHQVLLDEFVEKQMRESEDSIRAKVDDAIRKSIRDNEKQIRARLEPFVREEMAKSNSHFAFRLQQQEAIRALNQAKMNEK